MKKSIFSLCLAFAALAMAPQAQAQKTLTNGTISYEMEIEGNPMASAMGETKMEMSFKDSKSAMNMNMMNGMVATNMVFDNAEAGKSGLMLMSMMGKNMAVKMTKEDLDKLAEKQKNEATAPKVTEYTKVTKKIAGYKCYKATVETGGTTVVLYVCDKIKPAGISQFQIQYPGLNGYPLSIETSQMGMKIIFTATKINTKMPEDDLFKMEIPDGYEEKSMEELLQQGGGATGLFGM